MRGLVFATVVVACGALVTSRSVARAQNFVRADCPRAPTSKVFVYDYTTDAFDDDPACVATPPDPCPHYNNNIVTTHRISGNSNVRRVGLNFTRIDLENGFDFVGYAQQPDPLVTLTGNPPTGYRYTTSRTGTDFQRDPLVFRFTSDSIISDEGATVANLAVSCDPAQATGNPSALQVGTRHTGVLISPEDFVDYAMPAPGAGINTSLVLWQAQPELGDNFDIYMRCNAYPTPTAYDFATRGLAASQEYLLAGAGSCPAPGTWYVTVHAYAGDGVYHLVAAHSYTTQSHFIRVGFTWASTAGQRAGFAPTLAKALKLFWGATEGTQILYRAHMYATSDCTNCDGRDCDICYSMAPGTGSCCTNIVTVNIFQSYLYSHEGIAHELGHRWLSQYPTLHFIDDEYVGSQDRCGHSMMGFPWGRMNNFCYGADHATDPAPSGTPPDSGDDCWFEYEDNGFTPWQPSETPDNYDYVNHDFNNAVGVVTWDP